MARSFGDIGQSIFGWFFTRNDTKTAFQVSTKSTSTGFSVSRTTKDEDTVSSSLTATKDFPDSRYISCIDYTISNTDNISVDVQSDLFKHRNISLSASLFEPPEPKGTLEIGYNDQNKYSLDMVINTNFKSMMSPDINLSMAMDSLLMNKPFCFGASSSFEVAAEYQWNEDTVFALRGNENLKEMEFGFKKSQFRGNGNDTLFARLMTDRSEMDLMVGMRRQLDEESSIDVMVSNKDTLNVRYGVDNGSGLSGFIAAFINLKDPRDRAKLQYGVFIES